MMVTLKKSLLGSVIGAAMLLGVSEVQANALVCKTTTSIYDTLQVTKQDRPLRLTKTRNTFNVFWEGNDPYTTLNFQLSVEIIDPKQVYTMLRRVRYDDNIEVKVNGVSIFKRIGGGVRAFEANEVLDNHFVKGRNTIDIELRNNQSVGSIDLDFAFNESSCNTSELPRPIIPQLPNSEKCVESLVCTEGAQKRTINGVEVERDCWNWETKRTCMDYSQNPQTCVPPTTPSNSKCEMVTTSCAEEGEYTINGKTFNACMRYETKMQCTTEISVSQMTAQERAEYEAENERRRLLCKPVQTCVGTDCYITENERDSSDGDMPFVLALLELGRQAGTYMDPNNIRLFSGVASSCRSMRGFGAMAACCEVKSPVATNSSGQQVTPTNDNTFGNVYDNVETKFNNPTTSANEDYVQVGSNPYTYDALYKPNEAAYMLQGAEAMADTKAGTMGLNMGGASTITVMGYGWSNSGTATGDQQSFNQYSSRPNEGTPND
jgi:hypothetical protein